eukprot:jgi/Orpsp1_1/1190676/evm.model.d7180000080485.1
MSNSKVVFKNILEDIETNDFNTNYLKSFKAIIENNYKSIKISNNFENIKKFEDEYNIVLNILTYVKENDIVNLKNIIEGKSLNFEHFNLVPYNLLLDAIDRNSNQEVIKYCIEVYKNYNYNFNIKNENNETLLMKLLKNEKYKIVQLLLNNVKDINVNIENNSHETPLIVMINNKSTDCEIFMKLIAYGANLNIIYDGKIPLILAIKNKKIEYIKIIINQPWTITNNFYNGKTIMSHLIDNVINDEIIYNYLFKNGAYIDFKYIMNTNKYLLSLIGKNQGLIKSIIRNGIYTKRNIDNNIIHISTPLIYFVKAGQHEIVKILLENNANVEETDDKGFTPIFCAINSGNIKIFDILLDKYYIDITKKNKDGETPLMLARRKGNGVNKSYFIERLNKYNENINKNNNINSSIDKKNKINLINAIMNEQYEEAKKILSNSNIENENYENLLITLINNKSIDCEIFKILILHGADPFKNFNGKIPIILAIKNKKIDYLKIVFKKLSFKVNDYFDGKMIMSHLIDNIVDDEEIFNLLFKKSAYISYSYIINNGSDKILLIEKNLGLIKSIAKHGFYTNRNGGSDIFYINTPVIYFINATKNNVVQLLLDNGASVDEKDENGLTPIFYTIKSNNSKLFKLLLNNYHANVTLKNKQGQTPLQYALNFNTSNQNQFINALKKYENNKNLSSSTNVNILLNLIKDTTSNEISEKISLIEALKQEKYNIVNQLLDKNNIDVNIKNENQETPLMIMINNKKSTNCEIFKKLILKGASIS